MRTVPLKDKEEQKEERRCEAIEDRILTYNIRDRYIRIVGPK